MAERLLAIFNNIGINGRTDVNKQLTHASGGQNSADDIVVVSALRTPIGKAKRGAFKDTPCDDLLAVVLKAVVEDAKINPADIGDICVGNVLDPGSATTARLAQFYSGIPETVPVYTTNRQCSSGLVAFMNVAAVIFSKEHWVKFWASTTAFDAHVLRFKKPLDLSIKADNYRIHQPSNIKSGCYNVGVAAGVESMSTNSRERKGYVLNPRSAESQLTKDVLLPMGAKKAADAGLFDAEIVPVTTTVKDENGKTKTVTVSKDEGIRPTTLDNLKKLKPAFKANGSTTAGNASQVSDGAAAVLLMTRAEVQRRGLPVLGILRSFAVKGCPPDVMGIGPAVAIPIALEKAGLTVNDIDIFEINEAFASQAVYCVKKLGIPIDRVNPKGGAIALGHPLGCTGARQIGTLLHELKRRGRRSYGVISMCMGTGMGAAAVFEYPGPS